MHVPSVQAAIAKRLGPLPLWQGRDPFLATMEKLYADASRNALDAVDAARERVELEAGAGEPADELSDPS
jgi:hypothetical protein